MCSLNMANRLGREPEVVWVYDEFRLIDAESYQRAYSRKNGQPLVAGYYIVAWPEEVAGQPIFGDEAVFHGPYRFKKKAEADLDALRTAIRSGKAAITLGRASERKRWVGGEQSNRRGAGTVIEMYKQRRPDNSVQRPRSNTTMAPLPPSAGRALT